MSESELISIREFSRRVGVSDTAVLKAIKAQKITKDCLDYTNPKRPKVYPLAALASWGRNYAPGWNQSPALNNAIETANQVPPAGTDTKKSKTGVKQRSTPVEENTQGTNEEIEEESESDVIRISKNAAFNEAKRVQAILEARLAQVKLLEQKRKLVSVEKMYKDFYDVGVRVRSSLQGLPDKIIDNLLACDTRSEAHAMLYASITECLEGLSLNNVE